MIGFFSYLRFVVFDENMSILVQLKSAWEANANKDASDEDWTSEKKEFRADDLPVLSLRNEKKVWETI